jgi:hypothetical protein
LLKVAKTTSYPPDLTGKDTGSGMHFLREMIDNAGDVWLSKTRKCKKHHNNRLLHCFKRQNQGDQALAEGRQV